MEIFTSTDIDEGGGFPKILPLELRWGSVKHVHCPESNVLMPTD